MCSIFCVQRLRAPPRPGVKPFHCDVCGRGFMCRQYTGLWVFRTRPHAFRAGPHFVLRLCRPQVMCSHCGRTKHSSRCAWMRTRPVLGNAKRKCGRTFPWLLSDPLLSSQLSQFQANMHLNVDCVNLLCDSAVTGDHVTKVAEKIKM